MFDFIFASKSLSWVTIAGGVGTLLWLILKGVAVARVNKWVDKRLNFQLFPLSKYKASLKSRLSDMPFLYRDMSLSARDDYVEMVLSTADGDANPVGIPTVDYRTPLIRFRQFRRSVLFGEGGFGKTTLFRHVILRSMDGRGRTKIFGRRSIPVFVALKTVKLSSEFPVLEAIQNSAAYFAGERGYARLRKLARQGRLAIFLDGYDEMPYSGGVSHAVSELETLFGNCDARRPNFFEANRDFYKLAQHCRVYLSSRREFFFYNQFPISSDVSRWLARGLGDRRSELLGKIFSRYRGISTFLDERLDEELFLQQLAATCNPHLIELSFSPLFLTVMSYIYVEAIRGDGQSGAEVFKSGAHGLIDRCIWLLINDVDEYKARGLSAVQRTALLNRRSAYPQHKIAFLQFFAARLYEQDVGVFDRDLILSCAKEFFSRTSCPSEVLKGLDSADPSINNVDQLIFCGVLVTVDVRNGIRLFDFPHRSFREALAVGYYSSPENIEVMLSKFDLPAFGELTLVFIEHSAAGHKILEAILAKAANGSYQSRHGELLLSGLKRSQPKLGERIAAELINSLSSVPEAKVPAGLVAFLPKDEGFWYGVMERLRILSKSDEYQKINFWLAVIMLGGHESTISRLTLVVRSFHKEGVRAAMYVPGEMSRDLRRALIDCALDLCGSREDLERVLFDIYQCFFIGKQPADKNFIHEVLAAHGPLLSRHFSCEGELLRESLDFAFGGIALLDGRKSAIKAEFRAPAAFSCQFYSVNSDVPPKTKRTGERSQKRAGTRAYTYDY